jgi:hypothetical protein
VEYEAAGIPEYWLIDPVRLEAVFYQLGEDGHYHAGSIDQDGIYRSAVLAGFWLRVAWLWQQPLPPVLDVAAQIGGTIGARATLAALRAALGDDGLRALLDESPPK